MSAQATGPETLGSLSDEPEINDPNSKQAKEISGKSPMQIALGRLRKDKIAIVCAVVVLFFLLVAIFADLIAKAFGVSLDTVTACEVLECNFAEPGVGYPKTGPPFYAVRPRAPLRHRAAHRRGQPGPLDLRLPHLADDRRLRRRCSPR